MSSIYKRTLEETLNNKRLRQQGKHIAIPFPFTRFSEYFPGIMRRRYYGVTANSKVGKTKITDFLFVINPFLFSKYTPTNIKPKITYFSLEMSSDDKIKELRSFFLFYYHKIIIPPDVIDSIYSNKILNDDVEAIIKSDDFLELFEEIEDMIEYVDYTKNPFGIYKHIRGKAHSVGQYYDKNNNPMDMGLVQRIDSKGYKVTEDDRIALENFNRNIGFYKQFDEDEYHIDIIDHARLLTVEKAFNNDDRKNIENFSSNYLMSARDRWSRIPVLVQQQAASQESVENAKADKLRPSPEGLGISKNTQQDFDTLLGLYAPSRHNKRSWEGYDISRMKDRHREFEILLNRRGNAVRTQLYFNGACNFFKELPRVDEMVETVYEKIEKEEVYF